MRFHSSRRVAVPISWCVDLIRQHDTFVILGGESDLIKLLGKNLMFSAFEDSHLPKLLFITKKTSVIIFKYNTC